MRRVIPLLLVLAVSGACGFGRDSQLASALDQARAAIRRGDLAEARARAESGLSLASPDSVWSWTFRLLRGEILLLQRQTTEVPSLVAAAVPGASTFNEARARQKFLEARLQLAQNHLPQALEALDAARRAAPDHAEIQLETTWLDGQIRMRLGQWSEAESRLTDVVARAAKAGDLYQQARALNDLGMGGVVRGRWDEALQRFERVLSFTELGSFTVYRAALLNAGICFARLGEFERAVEVQRLAVDLHKGAGPPVDLERALGELGNTLLQRGDARQASVYYQQALTTAKDADLAADAALWTGNLAAANVELEEWNNAERFNDEARRLKAATKTGVLVHNTLTAARIAKGRGQLDEAARLFNEAMAGAQSYPDVRWAAYAGLADVDIARGRTGPAARNYEAALDTIEKTRSELLKPEYRLSFLTRLIEFYDAYVDALVNQGRFERALEVTESSRGRVLAERSGMAPPARASAAALRQIAARSRSVLLSYWLGSERSYAWVVNGTSVRLVHLPPAAGIESLVLEYQTAIHNSLADPLAAGSASERLFRMLVEPVLPLIPAGSRVIIVPDRSLYAINFETLAVPGPKPRYWIEDVEVQAAPSLSLLTTETTPSPRARTLLLFGDPAPHAPDFPALKYAAAEIENVSKHFPSDGVTAYQGTRASPSAYKAATPGRFSFVHFTAHAAANIQSPLDSAVILSGDDARFKLYARDVADVPLRADLVTVSACRSAGERSYSGEGLIGFAWAFLRAGANRVIAGLWDVDDRSTVELMDRLYAEIASGKTPAQALRVAKLSLIARGGNYSKPYYWGPFQIFTLVP